MTDTASISKKYWLLDPAEYDLIELIIQGEIDAVDKKIRGFRRYNPNIPYNTEERNVDSLNRLRAYENNLTIRNRLIILKDKIQHLAKEKKK